MNPRVGVWSLELRQVGGRQAAHAAQRLDSWGYQSVWIPGRDRQPGLFERVELLLANSTRMTVGIGIANIWEQQPTNLAEKLAVLDREFPSRFFLGLGVGHRSRVDARGLGTYGNPIALMAEFLDELTQLTDHRTVLNRVVLAALGPKMTALANERCAGVITYFAPVEHTRQARRLLNPRKLLVAEQAVCTSSRSPGSTPPSAAEHMHKYVALESYRNNLKRLGYEVSSEAPPTDELTHRLVSIGTPLDHASRLSEHALAGASETCVHVLSDTRTELPLREWEAVSRVLDQKG